MGSVKKCENNSTIDFLDSQVRIIDLERWGGCGILAVMNALQLRRIRRTALGFTAATALVGVAIVTIAPQWIVQPMRRHVGWNAPEGVTARLFQLSTGIALPAWEVKATNRREPRAAIVLLPGITDSKASQIQRALAFAEDGFDAITIDHRAHGDNSAPYATFGSFEKYDIRSLVEILVAQNPSRKVGIWGNSYGGAVALQAVAITPQISFAIIESTFAFLPDVIENYMTMTTPLRGRWISDLLLARAGKIASFNPWEVCPVESARQINVPILHIHGDSDPNIPFSHARKLRTALKPELMQALTIPGGGHFGLDRSPLYAESVRRFLAVNAP